MKITDLLKNISLKLSEGIHTNCALNKAWIEDGTIRVSFVKEIDGLNHSAEMRTWFPKSEYVKPRENSDETMEQAWDRAWAGRLSSLALIATLLSETEKERDIDVNLSAEGAGKLVKHIQTLLEKYPKKTFNVAVEENKAGYLGVARYNSIELYVEGQEPKIKAPKSSSELDNQNNDNNDDDADILNLLKPS